MSEITARLVDMPTHIRGLSAVDEEGTPLIYLNARLTAEQHRLAYDHELRHLLHDDHFNEDDIAVVEQRAEQPHTPETPAVRPPETVRPDKLFNRRPGSLQDVKLRGWLLYGLHPLDSAWDAIFIAYAYGVRVMPYYGPDGEPVTKPHTKRMKEMLHNLFDEVI